MKGKLKEVLMRESVVKKLSLIIAIIVVLNTLIACGNSETDINDVDGQSNNTDYECVEGGFSNSCLTAWTCLFCAYKLDDSSYQKDEDVNFTLYFGAADERHFSFGAEEGKAPVCVRIVNGETNEKVILHEFDIDELFTKKYLVDYDDNADKFVFNHSEQITLPKEMLTEDKGSVHIQIEHISDEDMDTFEYGCSSAAFFYLKKDDNIIFSTKEFK